MTTQRISILTRLVLLVVCFLQMIPEVLLRVLVLFLSFLTGILARKELFILRQNIHRIWHIPPRTTFSKMFEKQVIRSQIVCNLETLQVIKNPKKISLLGYDELSSIIRKNEGKEKGLILISGHLGSWELCAFFAARVLAGSLYVLAKRPRSKVLADVVVWIRKQMGVTVLYNDAKALIKEMVSILHSANSLGFVMDQKPENRQGPVVDFFGLPTEFVVGPAKLTVKLGCPVISLFCMREGPWRYRIISKEILQSDHGETDEQKITQLFANEIERIIKIYPEQWTWNYKRWRFAK